MQIVLAPLRGAPKRETRTPGIASLNPGLTSQQPSGLHLAHRRRNSAPSGLHLARLRRARVVGRVSEQSEPPLGSAPENRTPPGVRGAFTEKSARAAARSTPAAAEWPQSR